MPPGNFRKLLRVAALAWTAICCSVLTARAGDGPPAQLTVGSELDFPPYAEVDAKGNARGFSVELFAAVAEKSGLSVRFVPGEWNAVWRDLTDGKLDALPLVARLPNREGAVEFTSPHTFGYDTFFVRRDHAPIESLEAARNASIIVMRSDAAHDALLSRGFSEQLVFVNNLADGFRLLASGQHDALLAPLVQGQGLVNSLGLSEVIGHGHVLKEYRREFCFATRKGDLKLRDKLETGLAKVKESGEYDRLYRQWLGIYEPVIISRANAYWAIGAILATIAVLVAWTSTLRRLVASRTTELSEYKEHLEQRVAERTAALSASEARFRLLVEQSPDGIFVAEISGRYIDVNSAGAAMLGYTREEILDRSISDVIAPEEIRRLPYEVSRYADGAVIASEWTFLRKDGSTFIGEVVGRQMPDGRLQAILRDITWRKADEVALRESEERLRMALEAAQMISFEHEIASDRIFRRGSASLRLGLDAADVGAEYFARIHPEDRQRLIDTLGTLSPERSEIHLDYRIRIPDGSYRWLSEFGRGRFDEAGRLVGVRGVVKDIHEHKESDLALAHERELLAAIIDNIPVMLSIFDAKQRRFKLNRQQEKVLGWTTEEANRGDLMESYFPDPIERAEAAGYMRQAAPGWKEFAYTAKDGSRIPCQWANVALTDHCIGIGIDLRERKAVEARLARQARSQSLLLETAAGVLQHWGDEADMARVLFDKVSGHLEADVCINFRLDPASGEMTLVAESGIPEGRHPEIRTIRLGEGFCGTVADKAMPLTADRRRIESDDRGAFFRSIGVRAYACHPLYSFDGRVMGTFALASTRRDNFSPEDVEFIQTIAYLLSLAWERRQAEREIQALNADLEMRIDERTAELMAANRELEGFTFAASHDLKGPLGRINSFGALLEQQYRDRLEGNGLVFLDFIRQNALRLTHLVDDLLDHARVAQQAADLQPIDVGEVVQSLLREKADEFEKAGARISLEFAPAQITGDAYALHQALSNLLENALKFSVQANPPVIRIGGRIEGDRYVLWVRDNGIGFDMAYHDKIFQIFRRLHTYHEYPGSGVGLALVKRAMERMGGRVWAESKPGQGSTFFLEAPVACAPRCDV